MASASVGSPIMCQATRQTDLRISSYENVTEFPMSLEASRPAWRGFHHYATLCIVTCRFPLVERVAFAHPGPREAVLIEQFPLPRGHRARGITRSELSVTCRTRSHLSAPLSPTPSAAFSPAAHAASASNTAPSYDTGRLDRSRPPCAAFHMAWAAMQTAFQDCVWAPLCSWFGPCAKQSM